MTITTTAAGTVPPTLFTSASAYDPLLRLEFPGPCLTSTTAGASTTHERAAAAAVVVVAAGPVVAAAVDTHVPAQTTGVAPLFGPLSVFMIAVIKDATMLLASTTQRCRHFSHFGSSHQHVGRNVMLQ